jgi:hypothetical protein
MSTSIRFDGYLWMIVLLNFLECTLVGKISEFVQKIDGKGNYVNGFIVVNEFPRLIVFG